ncbi:MAG: hypothetical protein JWM16_185 [Verrucomicrobiales bacterium]|nr:hypothetical protein [Verrucomicrobiales bacterium]
MAVPYDSDVSSPKYLLVLEDSTSRLMALQGAAHRLSLEMMSWSDVHTMRKEAPAFFGKTQVISLDYDLSGSPYREIGEPGTGEDLVKFLLTLPPFCPVVIHTSLDSRGKMLAASLKASGWKSEWIGLKGQKDLNLWETAVKGWTAQAQ